MRTIFSALFILVFTLTSYSQSPVADSLFANNSNLASSIPVAYGGGFLVEQADGKLISGSYHYTAGFAEAYIDLMRFDRCGQLDSSFGVNGISSIHFDNINTLVAIRLQSDGKILCAGIQAPSTAGSQQVPYLARLNADGSADTTFNGTGSHSLRFDAISSGVFNKIDVLPDGRILATGICAANINGGQYALGAMRFMPDGSLDTAFNGDGIFIYQSVSTPLSHSNGHLLTDGNAVLAGHLDNQVGGHTLITILIDSTGNVVNSYGTAGVYTDPTIYSNAYVNFSTIDNNNNVLMIGHTNTAFPIRLTRVLPSGVLDASFGVNGFIDIPAIPFNAQRIILSSTGKMWLAGYSLAGNLSDGILQLNADGSIDSTFGINGILYTQISTGSLGIKSFLELPNDKLMAGFVTSQAFVKKFTPQTNVPHITDNGNVLSSTGSGSFQWFLNNSIINGATQSQYAYSQNGSYTVLITDVDGCTYLSDPYVVTSVGIDESSSSYIRLYPNPASDRIKVICSIKTDYQPKLWNSTGQEIEIAFTKVENQFNLDIDDVLPGLYFVSVNAGEKVYRKNFVKY